MQKTYSTQIAPNFDRAEAVKLLEAIEKACRVLNGNTPNDVRFALLNARREAQIALETAPDA